VEKNNWLYFYVILFYKFFYLFLLIHLFNTVIRFYLPVSKTFKNVEYE